MQGWDGGFGHIQPCGFCEIDNSEIKCHCVINKSITGTCTTGDKETLRRAKMCSPKPAAAFVASELGDRG